MSKKKRPTEADLEARREMVKNALHTRELALKAQAELDRKQRERERSGEA